MTRPFKFAETEIVRVEATPIPESRSADSVRLGRYHSLPAVCHVDARINQQVLVRRPRRHQHEVVENAVATDRTRQHPRQGERHRRLSVRREGRRPFARLKAMFARRYLPKRGRLAADGDGCVNAIGFLRRSGRYAPGAHVGLDAPRPGRRSKGRHELCPRSRHVELGLASRRPRTVVVCPVVLTGNGKRGTGVCTGYLFRFCRRAKARALLHREAWHAVRVVDRETFHEVCRPELEVAVWDRPTANLFLWYLQSNRVEERAPVATDIQGLEPQLIGRAALECDGVEREPIPLVLEHGKVTEGRRENRQVLRVRPDHHVEMATDERGIAGRCPETQHVVARHRHRERAPGRRIVLDRKAVLAVRRVQFQIPAWWRPE